MPKNQELTEYFDQMDAFVAGKSIHTPDDIKASDLRILAAASASTRNPEHPLYVAVAEKVPSGKAKYPQPLENHIAKVLEGENPPARSQLLISNRSHVMAIDFKIDGDKKECIVVDSTSDPSKCVKILAEHGFTVYTAHESHDDGVKGKISQLQHDYSSCPYFAITAAATLSKMDPYDHLKDHSSTDADSDASSLDDDMQGSIHYVDWEDMPPSLLVYAQGGVDRLHQFAERLAEKQTDANYPKEFMRAEEFKKQIDNQAKDFLPPNTNTTKKVNSGIDEVTSKMLASARNLITHQPEAKLDAIAYAPADQAVKLGDSQEYKQRFQTMMHAKAPAVAPEPTASTSLKF